MQLQSKFSLFEEEKTKRIETLLLEADQAEFLKTSLEEQFNNSQAKEVVL